MALMPFFTKNIITKQFEGSQIKRMWIFHVLTDRGLPGSEGLSGNAEAPLATRLHIHCHALKNYKYWFERNKELCSTRAGPVFSPDQNFRDNLLSQWALTWAFGIAPPAPAIRRPVS